MALFCLVHGSTQSPAGWDLLVPELQKLGHDTVRPDLPTGEPEASATHYAEVIAQVIPENSKDTIVVAHSASGLFLPLVPERRALKRTVFLAAVIPQIGVSLMQQFRLSPDMMNLDWIGKDPIRDTQVAMHFLFHDCSPEIASWALKTRRLMYAHQAMVEVCPLEHWPAVPASYIVCADDRTVRAEWCRRAARERLGVEAIQLPGGHCPQVSRPRELARILDDLAH